MQLFPADKWNKRRIHFLVDRLHTI
ncbi:hypothetical protein CGLO_12846 [Colletotrichum gloeosporioides Cg-14]|uniref:Uncharacterized protein n=1 Tax=Colletotrichum gloeosporioides (strain Cg-14) TaxID=1237896 RepID=T0L8N7_COLGC|nr:hypothetical protein CGLO_12846 [Colletotrichum gloeosporioides Cg-14]